MSSGSQLTGHGTAAVPLFGFFVCCAVGEEGNLVVFVSLVFRPVHCIMVLHKVLRMKINTVFHIQTCMQTVTLDVNVKIWLRLK